MVKWRGDGKKEASADVTNVVYDLWAATGRASA